jgi:cytochrome c
VRITCLAAASVVLAAATTFLTATVPAQAAPPAPDGETLFRQRCQACHTATAGQPARVGPNLSGVVGRKAAATKPFAYSAALKASGLTWTKASLDTFLSAPAKMVPGTRMVVAVTDPAQRAALIKYLSAKH